MSSFCAQWQNQTNQSHPFFDFKACHCAGEDLSGTPASTECYNSALRLGGLCVPVLVLLFCALCLRGGAKAIGLSLLTILIVVPLTPFRVLARLVKGPLMRIEAFAQMVVDVLAIRTQWLRRRARTPITIQDPILPPELWDMIIALCDHRHTLLACSLVCRDWVLMSRQHLAITLTVLSHDRARRLGDLLRSPVQTFSHCVHLITFGGEDFGQQRRVLRLLRLRRAKLDNATIIGYPRPVHHLLQYHPNLLELTFRVVPDHRHIYVFADQLQLFLSKALRFKCLRSLSILLVDVLLIWSSSGRLGVAPVTDMLPITRLALYGNWCTDLVKWLQSRCRCLQRLELAVDGGWPERENATVEDFIRANWQSLRHLTLAISAVSAPLSLSSAKHLESLHFVIGNTYSPSHVCVVKTLQTLNALQPLREVLIRIDTRGTRGANAIFPSGYPTAFSSVLVDKLGMELIDARPSCARYVQLAAFPETSIKAE